MGFAAWKKRKETPKKKVGGIRRELSFIHPMVPFVHIIAPHSAKTSTLHILAKMICEPALSLHSRLLGVVHIIAPHSAKTSTLHILAKMICEPALSLHSTVDYWA